jgi:molybdate transport system substrate-binding protein
MIPTKAQRSRAHSLDIPQGSARWAPLVVALLAVLAGCGGSASAGPRTTLNVYAAASLKDAFAAEDAQFQSQNPGVTVQLTLNGSNVLEAQLAQGATGDVFASADLANMDKARAAGLLAASGAQPFAHNRLVVIVPKANPAQITSLADLARSGVKIDVAGPSVPAGKYALQALDKLGAAPDYGPRYEAAVKANIVSQEENVKAVVAKVGLGEVDAGFVYVTDAAAAHDKVTSIAIQDQFNVIATYPIAALKNSPQSATAAKYVTFILSPDGQAILAQFGFAPAQ